MGIVKKKKTVLAFVHKYEIFSFKGIGSTCLKGRVHSFYILAFLKPFGHVFDCINMQNIFHELLVACQDYILLVVISFIL